MNFEFSEEQKLILEQARRLLREYSPIANVRRVAEGAEPYDVSLWSQLAEMGWLGIAIPEAYGGLGAGELELCLLAEALGERLAAVPFGSTVYLAARALSLGGSDVQKSRWLPDLAAGRSVATVALVERRGSLRGQRVESVVSDGRLCGIKTAVADGSVARWAVVSARVSASEEAEVALFLVDLEHPGVRRDALPVIDPSKPAARLEFHDVPVERLAEIEPAVLLARVLDGAATLFAFEQLGGADSAFTMARDYVIERKAFGRPLGSFQVIKHRLVDMYLKIQLARANSYYAAWALEAGSDELALAAASARISATDAFEFASQENIQLHGGIGYTYEADCHLYYRRSRALALQVGSAREWKQRLTSLLDARQHLERSNCLDASAIPSAISEVA